MNRLRNVQISKRADLPTRVRLLLLLVGIALFSACTPSSSAEVDPPGASGVKFIEFYSPL